MSDEQKIDEKGKDVNTTKAKKKGKFSLVMKLLKRNFISLHRLIWGKGWKRFIIAIVITFILLTVLMFLSLELTSKPKFCSLCHNMKPYYASWINSSHKHVTCTDCHFPPGLKNKLKGKFTALSMLMNYFTGIYKRNKPWAEISDESCLRSGCHDTRLLQGKAKFKENITFDHAPHLKELRRGKKLRCTSCHSQIVQGSHMTVTENTCFLCHFAKNPGVNEANNNHEMIVSQNSLNKCTRCHSAPVKDKGVKVGIGETPIYDHKMVVEKNIDCQRCHGSMVIGDGYVPKSRCDTCHSEVDKIKQYTNTALIHKNHITDHKIECEQCHTDIQHKSVSRTEMVKPDCSGCHPQFHNAQLDMFAGKEGKGVPLHPSSMFEAGLNCRACHMHKKTTGDFELNGETYYPSGEECNSCHGQGYDKVMNNWITQSESRLNQLSKVLDTAGNLVKTKTSHANYGDASQLLKDAIYNFKLVKFGKAVHNIDYANQLMMASFNGAEQSLKLLGISVSLPSFDKTLSLIPGECSSCHSGFERKPIDIFGWKFSHNIHLKKGALSCKNCHSNEPKHGTLIIDKQGCMNCHHKKAEETKELDCKQCHTVQQNIYYSTLEFYTFKLPNIMSESVTCTDCHLDKNKKIIRPDKTVCTSCHDKDYEQMFDDWQETGKSLLEQLRDKVKREKLKPGDQAYDILMLLEKDGSKGIHNTELYNKLIEETKK